MTAICTDPPRRVSSPEPAHSRHRQRAFTLLEVLAAVAVLGIWYVIIAGAAMQGLRREGQSRRELEASLIAERRLADIEAELYDGSVPEVGEENFELDSFQVRVRVAALPNSAAAAPASSVPEAADLDALLQSEAPGLAYNLRRISVEVRWPEGADFGSVQRETFAFDLANVRDFIEKAKQSGQNEKPVLERQPKATPERKS